MDYFLILYYFIYLMAQSAPHWWGMFFTQQTSCLPYVFLTYSSWYIGIYTVDTLLYSLCFTNCIIPFLPQLSHHPQGCNTTLSYSFFLYYLNSTNSAYTVLPLPVGTSRNIFSINIYNAWNTCIWILLKSINEIVDI